MTIFRGDGWSFANDVDFNHVSSDSAYWDDINTKFYKKYSDIDKLHYKWKDICLAGHPIVSPLGRYWKIEPFNSFGKINWTKFTNYPVQGTGADVMKLARVIFFKRLQKLNIPEIKLVSTVHDSIVVDCPIEYVKQVAHLFFDVFEALVPNIKNVFGYEWQCPLACEVKYGMNMKDMKKIKTRADILLTNL